MQAHFRQRRKLEGAEFDDGNAESSWGWKQDVRDSSDRACEVLDFYVRKVGKEPFVTHILHHNPHHDLSGIRRLQRQYWTAFKHAVRRVGKNEEIERDDETLLTGFDDEQNDVALLVGWTDYARATQTMPIEAQVHQAWYFAKNPSKLNPKHSPERFERLFPRLNSQPRSDQKTRLRERIEWAQSSPELMSHPKTDARPLILTWDP